MANNSKNRNRTGSFSNAGGARRAAGFGGNASNARTGSNTTSGSRSASRSTTSRTSSSSAARTVASRSATSAFAGARATGSGCAPGYRDCNSQLNQKISSFRALLSQTTGNASFQRPSPTTLNTFTNWINKGACIQTVTQTQLNRWAGAQRTKFNFNTTTGCKQFLSNRFGRTTIKAVARAKNGGFIVATAAQVKGRSFNFPS